MEPHGNSTSSGGNRAEADRWLLIAEKLLAGRDLVGSKTFAIRARDSDPTRLDSADQILAVADTLIAGEKRLNQQQLDWYSILQLPGRHAATGDLVASHYRRLSALLHRNRLPFADHALSLVNDAWSVLSNPSRKSLYDNLILLDNNNNSNSNSNYSTNEQDDAAAVRRSTRNSNYSKTRARTVAEEEIENTSDNNVGGDEAGDNAGGDNPSESDDANFNFWTACPYCYNMYEYPGAYVDCSLRCQNCRRAFHGTRIMAPPPIVEGKENYFCCWGFHPLGVSVSKLDKSRGGGGGASSWSPFSPPVFGGGPQFGEDMRGNAVEDGVNVGASKMNVNNAHKGSAPRIYVNDDDVYVEVSEPEEESDDDWGSNRQKKKAKATKGKDLTGNKSVKKPVVEKAKKLKGGGDSLQGGSLMPGVMGAPNVSSAETSRKVAGNSAKKQTGKFAKQWGRLDLNVEFSNEVEEPAPGMSRLNAPGMGRGNAMGMIRGNAAGNGEEEGMEGIGFFEGLDEFLSSLPILKS